MRSTHLVAFTLAATVCVGCRETPLVPDANQTPVADAQFFNAMGKSVDDEIAKAAKDPALLVIPYAGAPVAVKLNGSPSKDDGKIKRYQWFSGDSGGDAGAKRTGPNPEDVAQPTVMLDQGKHTFVLWVTDDQGVVSAPDAVTITVGALDPAMDPAVIECMSNVFSTVSDPCKLCICTPADCRPKVAESMCGEGCWGLFACIGTMCPDFMTNMGCVAEKCSSFFATGGAGAQTAGMCVTPCAAMCRPTM